MEIDRRGLMKGLLASGALLALGVPSWTFAEQPVRRPSRCLLILGDTGADEAFAVGADLACADVPYEGLRTVKLDGGLLTGLDRMASLLEQSRGTRMITVMEDAGALILLELARTAGARLLSMGTHVYSAHSTYPLRHVWATASPAHGVGGVLASQLAGRQGGFSIVEQFLQAPTDKGPLSGWSAPGFSSYRLPEAETFHLHCSGLSLADTCRAIGRTSAEGWETIPRQACAREAVRRQSQDWIESVGYAATLSALGVNCIQESCASRVFVRQSPADDRKHPQERFMTFVMDI
jgi:hypothetical protein